MRAEEKERNMIVQSRANRFWGGDREKRSGVLVREGCMNLGKRQRAQAGVGAASLADVLAARSLDLPPCPWRREREPQLSVYLYKGRLCWGQVQRK